MIWYEMGYNKPEQGFSDKLYLEPETFEEYDEVKEVINELDEADLFILSCN